MLTAINILDHTETEQDGQVINIALMIQVTDDDLTTEDDDGVISGDWKGMRYLTPDEIAALPKKEPARSDALRAIAKAHGEAMHPIWRKDNGLDVTKTERKGTLAVADSVVDATTGAVKPLPQPVEAEPTEDSQ